MANIRSISVKVWSYINKDGKEKNKYHKIGVLIDKDDWGLSIKLEDHITNYFKLLCGHKFDGWANVRENKDDEEKEEKTTDEPEEWSPF